MTTTNTTINATIDRAAMVTETNKLGLKEYDLVKTTGKGIGIVQRKQSLNDELVIYSISSANETHPNDDDGMAKVRRYNADGTIADRSEKTGKKLKNRGIYTITGIKSYANPVLAMKDFINQNEAIVFDPLASAVEEVVEETVETTEIPETEIETPVPTQAEINLALLATLKEIGETLKELKK